MKIDPRKIREELAAKKAEKSTAVTGDIVAAPPDVSVCPNCKAKHKGSCLTSEEC